jgi:hypothetical protein
MRTRVPDVVWAGLVPNADDVRRGLPPTACETYWHVTQML